jgi:hypothetical protein
MELITRLDDWFAGRLEGLLCRADTKAYVTGVLSGFKPGDVLSDQSIVLAWHEARTKGDFVTFQRIGDWVLWAEAMQPAFNRENRAVVESIGRMSYYACHRIMRQQWLVYEELADDLPIIAAGVRCKLGQARSIL